MFQHYLQNNFKKNCKNIKMAYFSVTTFQNLLLLFKNLCTISAKAINKCYEIVICTSVSHLPFHIFV